MPKVLSRATYHPGDWRQALIDAALEIIVEDRDAAHVSLREAARWGHKSSSGSDPLSWSTTALGRIVNFTV